MQKKKSKYSFGVAPTVQLSTNAGLAIAVTLQLVFHYDWIGVVATGILWVAAAVQLTLTHPSASATRDISASSGPIGVEDAATVPATIYHLGSSLKILSGEISSTLYESSVPLTAREEIEYVLHARRGELDSLNSAIGRLSEQWREQVDVESEALMMLQLADALQYRASLEGTISTDAGWLRRQAKQLVGGLGPPPFDRRLYSDETIQPPEPHIEEARYVGENRTNPVTELWRQLKTRCIELVDWAVPPPVLPEPASSEDQVVGTLCDLGAAYLDLTRELDQILSTRAEILRRAAGSDD